MSILAAILLTALAVSFILSSPSRRRRSEARMDADMDRWLQGGGRR